MAEIISMKEFKKLNKDYIKGLDKLKQKVGKYLLKEISGIYKIVSIDYFNSTEDFHCVFTLEHDRLPHLNFSIEDDNEGIFDDWYAYISFEDDLTEEHYNWFKKYVKEPFNFKDDEPLFKSTSIEETIHLLKVLSDLAKENNL